MAGDRAEAARRAWITIRANRAKAGYVPKATSGKPRAPRTSAGRRVKSSYKPVAFHSQSQFWSSPSQQSKVAAPKAFRHAASANLKGLSGKAKGSFPRKK